MSTLEVRRHSEQADAVEGSTALSPRGIGLARDVARASARYALVLSSPAQRARETAEIIGGRLDAVDEGLALGMSGVLGDVDWRTLDLQRYGALLRERREARAFAERQVDAWSRIATRVGAQEKALAVSHGGMIELGAALLAERLGQELAGTAFDLCEGVRVTFVDGAPRAFEILRTSQAASP
jgi:broad specificity phosphatase PhoE